MASKQAALSHCHKATKLGNTISIHMLEYLSTGHQMHGFEELAHDFLDVCRIMWALEAGLSEFTHASQTLPPDMLLELDRRFRTTHTDFQHLDAWLARFLEYERHGTVGRIQRGWKKMFADHDLEKMRDSLSRTREALRMSALVFQWSLGDAKIDDSVGIGYTGLQAALERTRKAKTVEVPIKSTIEPQVTARTDLSQVTTITGANPRLTLELDKRSSTDLSPFPIHEEPQLPRSPQNVQRCNSLSTGTDSSHGARNRTMTPAEALHLHRTLASNDDAASTSTRTAEVETLLGDMDISERSASPIKIIRIKADPRTMPRYSPRSAAGANTPAMRTALVSAIVESNRDLVEQLLDRGVSPDTGPDKNGLKEVMVHQDHEIARLLLLYGADPNAPDKNGLTPLYAAVEESFLDGATMLLKYGADPNLAAGIEQPDSPLASAIVHGQSNFIRLLLMYGGDPNHIMTSGETILIKAIMNKSLPKRIIDLLLGYGSDPNGKSRDGETALFEAIQADRVDIVTTLLDHGADPNLPGPKHMLWPATYKPDCLKIMLERGASPKKAPGIMELATSINNIESVRILLEADVDPNAKKDGVYTPLCTSIRDNRADIFKLLLSHGADPNIPASEYPCFKCVTHFRQHFLPELVAAGGDLRKPRGILETAVQSKNLEALKWLLDSGISPNDKTPKTGATPLTAAIHENRSDLVQLLLDHGADPNIRGQDWPICMAVRQPPILKLLLPHLAEPRAFKGVLEMAVTANQLESIKLLLAAGVSVEDRNGGVFSPLTTAIRERHKDIVRYLLYEAGADPNAPGEHLPIVKAVRRCQNGDTEIIEMLLEKGADPNKVYRGHNAVIQALENGEDGVLRVLAEKWGVDLDQKDETGRTVSELAELSGWDEARDILLEGQKILHMSRAPPESVE